MDKKKRYRNEFWEPEERFGERRSACASVPDPPSPVCKEKMSALREYVDGRFDANAEALTHRTKETDAHFLTLNNNQARLDKDREDFVRNREYKIEHRNLIEKVDDVKAIVDRNSDRLTKIESVYLKEKDVDEKVKAVKEFHEKDLDPIKKVTDTIVIWKATLEGKASRSNLISIIAILISVIFGILHFFQGVR